MDLGVAGRKALVCASSKGLGKAVAKALAQEGVRLFLCARNAETLAAAVAEIQQFSTHPVLCSVADLASAEGRERLIEAVRAAFGDPDILIHNVGGPKPSRTANTEMLAWQEGFEQLFQSVAHLNAAFLPGMKAQRWGRIICVTSLSAFEPIPELAVSNAFRPAITAMLKALANEVAPDQITVNCVAPGMILTDRTEERLADHLAKNPHSDRASWLADYAQSIPARRLGNPDEFGPPVAFLCSELASYITGSTLCVDGGKRRAYH
ncbi:SDR family oxidoreductase [Vampirovibrio sp.]|uniref:SDR family oxidoreductase n=1 Tax=Vampirovibrio sp. TaxID=2717857 RepID=UPI0035932809